jgi:hypothetical protein
MDTALGKAGIQRALRSGKTISLALIAIHSIALGAAFSGVSGQSPGFGC